MSRFNLARAGILAVTALGAFTGCGQTTSTTGTINSCASGSVYSSTYGCLPQSNCPSGYGLYNGSCVSLGLTSAGVGSCLSITQSIPFSGSGLQMDTSYNIYGGSIPGYATYGTLNLGSSSSVAGTTFTNPNPGSNGSIQMNVQASNSAMNGYAVSTASVNGALTIGPYYQQAIQSFVSNSANGITGTPCVSGVAIQGHLYTSGNYAFQGYVYLYLNNTQKSVKLQYY